MSTNPPVYTESPLLYQKVNAPEFVNRRLLIITYYNMGYSKAYIARQLAIKEKYCEEIINIFHNYGLKALLKRDYGLKQKKDQKKFTNDELNLLQNLVRHKPPKNHNKWTYNLLAETINHSSIFENNISLCTLRAIMLSKKIDLNAWKDAPLKITDENFEIITNLISKNDDLVTKIIKDYELDVPLTEEIIKDLSDQKRPISIINVFLKYKHHYNLPKLSIYKFSNLLKNYLPQWQMLKQQSFKNYNVGEKKITLSQGEVDQLLKISDNPEVPKISRMRAKICLELNKETIMSDIEQRTGCSISMIYRVYNKFKDEGIECITLKKRVSKKVKRGPYITTSIKKYPDLLTEIKSIVSSQPKDKTRWTIVKITKELQNRNYIISTTSISKLIIHHQIVY